jgi:hypothetical protein
LSTSFLLYFFTYFLLFLGPPDLKSRASVFKVILQDIEKEIGFDYNACAIMTDGYTPSDISALCGAAINSLLAEKKLTLQKEKKKERENFMKSDLNDSSKNSPKMSRISSRQLGLEVIIFIFFSFLFLHFFTCYIFRHNICYFQFSIFPHSLISLLSACLTQF